jgi:hypothetical protein
MSQEEYMRTTLDLPETLVSEAMEITNISQKTKLIITALENLIQKEKIKELKNYAGKLDLGIDIRKLRKR